MLNLIAKRSAGLQEVTGNKLKATEFFKENDSKGYFTKSTFENYANSLVRDEVDQFIGFIGELKNGVKLNLKLKIREDRSNRQYVWCEFMYARASKGYKIIIDGEILRFIEDYATGKITVDFTAEELALIALN